MTPQTSLDQWATVDGEMLFQSPSNSDAWIASDTVREVSR